MSLADIPRALEELRRGKPVIVVDDEGRENEGDVIISAQLASQEWIAWMVRHTSGYLCAPMTNELADLLKLPVMVADNAAPELTEAFEQEARVRVFLHPLGPVEPRRHVAQRAALDERSEKRLHVRVHRDAMIGHHRVHHVGRTTRRHVAGDAVIHRQMRRRPRRRHIAVGPFMAGDALVTMEVATGLDRNLPVRIVTGKARGWPPRESSAKKHR